MIQNLTRAIVMMNILIHSARRSTVTTASAFQASCPIQTYTKKYTSSRLVHNTVNKRIEPPISFPEWAYEPRDFFGYELIYQSRRSNARVGRIHTPHGIIETPGYVAVATNGALKGLDIRDADAAGQQLVFCNSYHLMLQPGPEIIEGKGGNISWMLDASSFLAYLCVKVSDKQKMQNAWIPWEAISSRVIDQSLNSVQERGQLVSSTNSSFFNGYKP